jgi:hypothetical protein
VSSICRLGSVTAEEKWGLNMMLSRRDQAVGYVSRIARRHKRIKDPNKQKIVMGVYSPAGNV